MAKKRVPLHQNPRGFVDVDPDATNGAQVGVNLRGPDGQLLTAAQVINPTTGGSGGPGSIASTIWKLIREVPPNIQKLAALIGAGFAVRKNDGEWALRTLQEGTGIDIANPDGDAGNPTIGLEDVPDSGTGTLLAITKDSKGRVTGTRPATITGTAQQIDVANGTAAAGLPTISLSNLPDSGVGSALVKITRDANGRVAGTQAATTDDLPAGAGNKYFPEAPNDGNTYGRKSLGWTVIPPGGFAPPPTDGSPYIGLNGAWERTNAADSRFWLIEYPLLTDQAGNQLTDQAGNFLMGNSPIVPPGWPSTTTVVNTVSSGTLQSMTLAQANALASPSDFQMVAITDLTGGREPCWYDATVASGTKWRRFSDRSIAN
ncbi:hypothetical protein [Stenotrophomonas maltophilia]|uniref:Uncharacterized protein n=1 Tax=Stenotrophomonas maltophilia TaxID=40324 RepID=A0A2W6HYG1_STEMA|nr:hypothetical protein [Stenotrophomonas maltophilia]PZS88133.1 hypothetical protein A7X83_15550 [Stenotrophomonas maltophilia]